MRETHEHVLRLQGGWRFFPSLRGEGIEVASPLLGKRLLLKGVDLEKVLKALEALVRGVPDSDPVDHLCKVSGLNRILAEKLIRNLDAHGALIRTAQAPPLHDTGKQYDRQIRFFDAFSSEGRSAEDINSALQKRRVVIVGLGGYGTWLALMLARLGVKHIVGIDFDRVELSNLNRQVLYNINDVGRFKVEACADAIAKIDRDIVFEGKNVRVTSPSDLLPYLEGADLVFNPFGYTPPGFMFGSIFNIVSQAAFEAKAACLHLGGSWIGPLTVPGETPCSECLLANRSVREIIYASLPHRGRPIPSIAPRMAITAGVAVWEAVRFLSGIDRPPSLSNLIILDLHAYTRHTLLPVERRVNCKVCGSIGG